MSGGAMIDVKVDVTAEDIACGVPSSCKNCPVALAIARATGLVADVDPLEITMLVNGYSVFNTRTPREVEAFIGTFDDPRDHDAARPFTFTIRMPADLLKAA